MVKGSYGVNTYRDRSRKKIGRHKKRLNKSEKPHKKYRGQGRWQTLQVYKIHWQKFHVFTSNTNIFLAPTSGCKYSKNMTDPKPQFPESNCVVHDDTFDWGG